MLDIFRKSAGSWIVKGLLLVLCLAFVLFFGSTTLTPSNKNENVIAKINGDVITSQELEGAFQLQVDSNPVLQNLPDQFKPQIKQSTLQYLIENQLTYQAASNLGLRISDKVVKKTILDNESLQKNGQFDFEFYKERFIPHYARRYGVNYETWLRTNLLTNKFKDFFEESLILSEDLLKQENLITENTIDLTRITIDPSKLGKEIQPKELAKQLWDDFIKDNLTEKQIEEYKLEKNEFNDVSLNQSQQLLDGEFDLLNIRTLFLLSKSEPYPEHPIYHGEKIYFFKCTDKNNPDFSKSLDKEKADQIQKNIANLAYQEWYSQLHDQSHIKVSTINPNQ